MKKILLVVLALILVALPLTACDNNDDNKIIVNETTHSIFYAPQYLAMALGYFEEAGYEIELINGQGSDLSMTAVVTGAADNARIGAGSVVLKNLPANCTAVGVPAEVVRINNKAVNPADDLDQQDLPDVVAQRIRDLDRRIGALENAAQGDTPPTASQIAARQKP